jgi:hypothetical protein
MLRFNFHQVFVFVATCTLGLATSTAMAQRGHRGGGHRGGGGHHSGGHHGGHGGYGHAGYGHVGHRANIGRHYGGYGGGYGFSRGGLSISIGGGYPYRYGGLGYRGIGYRSIGYRGFGYGYGAIGNPYSVYSPYRALGPNYSAVRSLPYGYAARPAYRVEPATDYVYPDRRRYSAAKPVVPSSNLRPGMVLPDGSRVLSVQPLNSAEPTDSAEPTEPPTEIEETEPIRPEPIEREPVEAEELPPAAIEPDETSASL